MYEWIFLPFVIQSIVIGIDEGYFHLRRGLPRWERIGHPLDTFSVFLCLLYVLIVDFSATSLQFYCILTLFSCIFVTKDEFIHKKVSPAGEQWLHALLFLNHPVLLTCTGLMWYAIDCPDSPSWISSWLNRPEQLYTFLYAQTVVIGLFFLYQVVYWNLIWKERACRR